ncbi:hypothetical protein L226DRAFT_547430 [Lentinus tigrinus ALCF2SS1-7]|uniref:Uncharacterized protein n=1 Tax=Lentinus tigrinus ALCF2SS1-6 TaxID=1328759 RepID=A0A5C2S0C2_9APHY|nr:hypothetical protein L227DRAFT_587849 [Lentinus tigrinus ALCF2SS1-6]RPD71113.1 hypothetical protein L226DRAFT_547430 [Lentinus tigrinus ALCF2SS1-7]
MFALNLLTLAFAASATVALPAAGTESRNIFFLPTTRERLGQIAPDEIIELPQVTLNDLEARVDSLRAVHLALLKVTKIGTTIGHGITNFAAADLKGTNLPAPVEAAIPQHKTLTHAIGRAATNAAAAVLSTAAGNEDKLGKGLHAHSDTRIKQDAAVRDRFLLWQTTLSTSIAVVMKARQAVRVKRLELDAAKQTLKNASPTKQEAARLEVENAEDDLVQKTEVAITLMKIVLENLAKAQMSYAAAAEALSSVRGEIEELSLAAEGEKSREHYAAA